MKRNVPLLLALALLSACGKKHEARSPEDVEATENAGRVAPVSDSERAVLKSLDDLPNHTARAIGGVTVQAEPPYAAASGERCRYVSYGKERRLACREPAGWYFVPDVFGAGAEQR
jgi:hypothetical protein